MEISEIRNLPSRNAGKRSTSFRRPFDLDQLEEDIAEAEAKMAEPGFGMTAKPHKSDQRK